MQNINKGCLLAFSFLVAGCTAEPAQLTQSDSQTSETKSPSQDEADRSYEAPAELPTSPQSNWSLNRSSSAIDGDVLVARRIYQPDPRLTFVADVVCIPNKAAATMTVDSFIGDPSDPLPGSDFARNVETNLWGSAALVPVGRAKANNQDVVELARVFVISDAASNRIQIKKPPYRERLNDVPEELRFKIDDKDINFVRLLADMLPMAIVVNNGLGAHELVIDRSHEVEEVLNACGGDGDVLVSGTLETLLAEAEANRIASEQAEAEKERGRAAREASAIESFRQQCRYRGSAPMFRERCQREFPEDYSAFQSDVDKIVEAIKAKKCKTDRDTIERNAGSSGLQSVSAQAASMEKCSFFRIN